MQAVVGCRLSTGGDGWVRAVVGGVSSQGAEYKLQAGKEKVLGWVPGLFLASLHATKAVESVLCGILHPFRHPSAHDAVKAWAKGGVALEVG